MAHIVVVDDERLIRLFIEEALLDCDFSVELTDTPINTIPLFDDRVKAADIDVGWPHQPGDRFALR